MTDLPRRFVDNVVGAWGGRGERFLAALPSTVAAAEARFGVRAGAPYELTYNWVARAERVVDGVPVVLKIGIDLAAGSAALRHWAGCAAVALLDDAHDLGALGEPCSAQLLERVVPGDVLDDDDDGIRALARVARSINRPAPADTGAFDTVVRWGEGFVRLRETFGGGAGPFDAALVDRAERVFAELLGSSAAAVVLHGDLHPGNVLASTRDAAFPYVAIDPKGVVGEPAYECGCALRQPITGDERASLARRIAIFAEELGLDRERVREWAFAQSVLSAWWSYEDQEAGYEAAMHRAAVLLGSTSTRH